VIIGCKLIILSQLNMRRFCMTNRRRDLMKKIVALLTVLLGASASMLTYADANQPSSDNSQQQAGANGQQGNTDSSSNTNSSSDSTEDDDTSS
jgi:hypothetical protein